MWCSCGNADAMEGDYLCVGCRGELWWPDIPVMDIRRSGCHTREVVWIVYVETRYNKRWGTETYYWSETHERWVDKDPYDEIYLWQRRKDISRWAYD